MHTRIDQGKDECFGTQNKLDHCVSHFLLSGFCLIFLSFYSVTLPRPVHGLLHSVVERAANAWALATDAVWVTCPTVSSNLSHGPSTNSTCTVQDVYLFPHSF